MARRSFGQRVVRSKSDRGNVWLGLDLGPTTIAPNTLVLTLSLTAAEMLLRPFTVIRTHLEVSWQSDQGGATENPHGALGIIVVNDQALGIGASAIPDPLNQPDAPFFVWQGLQTQFTFGSGVGFDADAGSRYAVDSKAMRKVGNNEDIAVMVANANTAHGADVGIKGRMLVKLL